MTDDRQYRAIGWLIAFVLGALFWALVIVGVASVPGLPYVP